MLPPEFRWIAYITTIGMGCLFILILVWNYFQEQKTVKKYHETLDKLYQAQKELEQLQANNERYCEHFCQLAPSCESSVQEDLHTYLSE